MQIVRELVKTETNTYEICITLMAEQVVAPRYIPAPSWSITGMEFSEVGQGHAVHLLSNIHWGISEDWDLGNLQEGSMQLDSQLDMDRNNVLC